MIHIGPLLSTDVQEANNDRIAELLENKPA